jgi:hypothetical protein
MIISPGYCEQRQHPGFWAITLENVMLRSTLIILLLAFSTAVSAEGFNYNYISVGYGNTDFDGLNEDGDGFIFGGSFAYNDSLHAFAGYEDAELNSVVDVTRWNAGVGYNTSLSDTLDMFARLSYESLDFNVPVPRSDDSGYGFSVGARLRAGNQLELNAAVNYVDYNDFGDDTGFEIGVLYDFNNTWALGLLGEWSDDVSTYTIIGRFYFGQ